MNFDTSRDLAREPKPVQMVIIVIAAVVTVLVIISFVKPNWLPW